MRFTRRLSPKQVQRVKYMSIFVLMSFCGQLFTANFADAAIKDVDFEGPYLFNGEKYDKFNRVYNSGGFIEEYTNKDEFCTSWVYHPGLSLLGDAALGICYLLFLVWLFVGISILADIFMEAIEVITSKAELVQISDADGNMISVEKMFWNPTIANLTLMALGSSAPEIILSVADTMGTLGEIPSELGPQAIVGSAAFNLLVISAVSIVAVTEVKGIKMVGVFLTTAIFSSWAYAWFFLVLVVISPGYVEIWEAAVTLGFMLLLVIIAYSCDVCHGKGESIEERRREEKRKATKAAIRILTKKFGVKTMLEVGQGNNVEQNRDLPTPTIGDVDNINSYFTTLLTVDPKEPVKPTDVSINQLLDCLQPDNAVERIMYRKEVGGNKTKDFLKLEKGAKGQAQTDKEKTEHDSQSVCFKHLRYEVAESNQCVTITIEKKTPEDFTFWVRTIDVTAQAGEDYEEKNELFTMHAEEKERQIQIGIIDDPQWEPDETFKVQLLDEITQARLPGNDTECEVLIVDEDKPGSIGFAETQMEVRRKDQSVYVLLKRTNGSDGVISCLVNTDANEDAVQGKKAAIAHKDFVPIKDMKIEFGPGIVEQRIEIEMPDCEVQKLEDEDEDEIDTVSFQISLSAPKPEGVKLSKRQTCFINIEATDDLAEQAADFERRKMLDFFLSEKDVTYGQQFKIACMLGPSIDQDDLIAEDVSGGEAFWHCIAMAWKIVGACVPPRKSGGGWWAFLVALALIGIVTTVIGEVATVLGCVINLKPSVTGITLVAMGTSLPDTFASMTAARTSNDADSAIGNVTGSNSVNVFLGMGIPWIIGTIYWKTNSDADYAVPPGSLSFSVIMFLCCSMVCFLVLGLRRCFVGGELGGEGLARPLSAVILFCLWLIYVVFVSMESYGVITIEIGDVPEPPEL